MELLRHMTEPYDKYDMDKIALRDAIFKIISKLEELEKRVEAYTAAKDNVPEPEPIEKRRGRPQKVKE